eukprot:129033-Chlamydomonas_euryale.AAC.2
MDVFLQFDLQFNHFMWTFHTCVLHTHIPACAPSSPRQVLWRDCFKHSEVVPWKTFFSVFPQRLQFIDPEEIQLIQVWTCALWHAGLLPAPVRLNQHVGIGSLACMVAYLLEHHAACMPHRTPCCCRCHDASTGANGGAPAVGASADGGSACCAAAEVGIAITQPHAILAELKDKDERASFQLAVDADNDDNLSVDEVTRASQRHGAQMRIKSVHALNVHAYGGSCARGAHPHGELWRYGARMRMESVRA